MTQRLCHRCQQAPLIIGLVFGESAPIELCGDCFKQFAQEVEPLYIEAKVFSHAGDEEKLRAAIERIRGARKLAEATPGGTA